MKFSNHLSHRFFTSLTVHSFLSIFLIFVLLACSQEKNNNTVDFPSDQTISETVQTQFEKYTQRIGRQHRNWC